MKKLVTQALAFQYQLQIENAQAVLNNNNAALNIGRSGTTRSYNCKRKIKSIKYI